MKIYFVESRSYRTQLMIPEIVLKGDCTSSQIQKLITRLRTSLLSAKFRRQTLLRSKFYSATWCRSTFKVFHRHIKLGNVILNLAYVNMMSFPKAHAQLCVEKR